jgi:hypothetical protein
MRRLPDGIEPEPLAGAQLEVAERRRRQRPGCGAGDGGLIELGQELATAEWLRGQTNGREK